MSEDEYFVIDFHDDMEGFNQMPKIKIYLAGPLTGYDDDTIIRECREIRASIKEILAKFKNKESVYFEIYDPGEKTAPGSGHSPDEVYEIDQAHTTNADLVIFHINVPSLGVGIEAQIAADVTIPRVIISRNGVEVST